MAMESTTTSQEKPKRRQRRRKPEYTLPDGRLWPNTPSGSPLAIEVFGATGEYKSGKTLLGLSIAPGTHPDGHPHAGKPRTLYLDFEKSGGTYAGTGCNRIDVPAKMGERFAKSATGYRPIDVFQWFLNVVENLPDGQYDVIMADPITDIESGMVDYVKKHTVQFGLTEGQVTKGGGLLWGAVKDYWKQLLLKLSTKCQCFYFTSHLRSVWAGNQPIRGKKEPKGKETLMELASLYLWLDRSPDADGNVSAVPSAEVLKERVSDTVMDDDGNLEIIQLLPPRLPEATIDAIRGYIAKPPDYSRLRDDERVVERALSEDEKLQIEESIARSHAEASESQLQIIARQAELAEAQRASRAATPQTSDQTAKRQAEKAKQEAAKPAEPEPDVEGQEIASDLAEAQAGVEAAQVAGEQLMADNPDSGGVDRSLAPINETQLATIKQLIAEVQPEREKLAAALATLGADRVSNLSTEAAGKLIAALQKKWATKEGK